ncbi:NUDIX hydrolase [Phormidium sp. CCY1219]|uniref:NUDIX hydrolase n=1 Tax=Phormidium sp. CCY1219 TaxID=2886104 RepID=UPI002D1EBC3E|nr:NUDIX hydrolase [Phormidium sp. CCY1219]MEB3831020.1 NUDIX hydrolase [Phormidium sp. CCY1219]
MRKEIQKWKSLRSQLVFENQWCKVRRDEVQLPSGEIIDDFYVNLRPDIALVFPLTQNNEIVFVRQYRHGVGEILLELPAGAFDPETEIAAEAAAREMTEETGYISEELIPLATLYDNPVKDTNAIHVFFAKNARDGGGQKLDLTEQIEVVLVPVSRVMEKINRGEICVSGSVAAVFLGLNFLNQQKNIT